MAAAGAWTDDRTGVGELAWIAFVRWYLGASLTMSLWLEMVIVVLFSLHARGLADHFAVIQGRARAGSGTFGRTWGTRTARRTRTPPRRWYTDSTAHNAGATSRSGGSRIRPDAAHRWSWRDWSSRFSSTMESPSCRPHWLLALMYRLQRAGCCRFW